MQPPSQLVLNQREGQNVNRKNQEEEVEQIMSPHERSPLKEVKALPFDINGKVEQQAAGDQLKEEIETDQSQPQPNPEREEDLPKLAEQIRRRITIATVIIVFTIMAGIAISAILIANRDDSVIIIAQGPSFRVRTGETVSTELVKISQISPLIGSTDSQAIVQIVKPEGATTTTNGRRLEEVQNEDEEPQGKYFGIVDFNKGRGVVIRYLNPINSIVYLYPDILIQEYRRIGFNRHLSEKQIVEEVKSRLLNLKLGFSVEVLEEKVWKGQLNDEKLYSIEKIPVDVSENGDEEQHEESTNLNVEEEEKNSKDVAHEAVTEPLKVQNELMSKVAKKISSAANINFDSDTDVYVISEKVETHQSKETQYEDGQMQMMTMYEEYAPKPPTTYTRVAESVLANRPSDLKEAVTVNKLTYDSIIACNDFDLKTKYCTIAEWKNSDSPFSRVDEPEEEDINNKVYRRIRIMFTK